MPDLPISKQINQGQLGGEIQAAAGLAEPPGLKMRWDGTTGYVRVLHPTNIPDQIVIDAIAAHVYTAPVPPPPDPQRQAEARLRALRDSDFRGAEIAAILKDLTVYLRLRE